MGSSIYIEDLLRIDNLKIDDQSSMLRLSIYTVTVKWPQEVTLIRWTQPSGPLCFWQCLSLTHWYCLSVIVSFYLSSSKFIYCSKGRWSGWSSKVICFLRAPSVLKTERKSEEKLLMATQCGEGPALWNFGISDEHFFSRWNEITLWGKKCPALF